VGFDAVSFQMFDGSNIEQVEVVGDWLTDTMTMILPTKERETQCPVEFLAVNSLDPALPQFFDGFIGLAPIYNDPSSKDTNFMYQLKQQGLIDHLVFSVYLKPNSEETSFIKFGSMDADAIVPGG